MTLPMSHCGLANTDSAWHGGRGHWAPTTRQASPPILIIPVTPSFTSKMASAVLLIVLLVSLLTAAVTAIDVSFSADLTAPITPVLGTVYDSFGSSHGSTTLRAIWRDHLAAAKQDIPFSRVRFHGILDDDMSTFLNGEASTALVFDTLDFLVAQRITPTIEVSFMPEDLASNPSLTVFHYKGGASPPSSWDRWRSFITQFARLLVARYSLAVVRTWPFEVWNEPNCGFYYNTGCCGANCGNQTAYFQLYAETAQAVKAADPSLMIGGPSTAQLGWIPEFLAAARSGGAPVDFVSSHLYPSDASAPTRESFMDAIAASTALARAAGVPFLLTEFNSGLGSGSNNTPILDSSYAAAFLLHSHLRAQGIAGLLSMSYWVSDNGQPRSIRKMHISLLSQLIKLLSLLSFCCARHSLTSALKRVVWIHSLGIQLPPSSGFKPCMESRSQYTEHSNSSQTGEQAALCL